MPPQGEVARQWFIPGDGIDRNVISTDIQRYLGNDATVRPGSGTGEYHGVQGYWIKAYRNLTSAMIEDLKADSQRWRQEQRHTGSGGSKSPESSDTMSGSTVPDSFLDNYAGSRTYNDSNAAAVQRRDRDGNSPSIDGYAPSARRQPDPRMDTRQVDPRRQAVDPMQIDTPPANVPRGQAYQQPQPNYFPPDAPGQYPADRGGYQAQGRGQGFTQDQTMGGYGRPDAYGRIAAPPYNQDQRFAQGGYQPNDVPPQGMVRQGDYYVPITSGYGQPGMTASVGPDGPYGGGYGQAPPQSNRAQQQIPMDHRGGPVYNQPDYGTDRYAYPSPAQTVSSVNQTPRDIASPTQPSGGYGPAQGPYDQQHGGRPISNQTSQYVQPGYSQSSIRDPSNYARDTRDTRDRPPAPSERDARRRRNG